MIWLQFSLLMGETLDETNDSKKYFSFLSLSLLCFINFLYNITEWLVSREGNKDKNI